MGKASIKIVNNISPKKFKLKEFFFEPEKKEDLKIKFKEIAGIDGRIKHKSKLKDYLVNTY